MYVHEVGSGDPVLVLHGCPSTSEMVAPVTEALQDTHHVLTPDLPGYGQSPRVESFSHEMIRQELIEMLRHRGIESLSIVGHCLGAYDAVDLALHSDLDVKKLALLGAFIHPTKEMSEDYPVFAGQLRQGADLSDLVVERWVSARCRAQRPEFAEQIRQWWHELDPLIVADDIEATMECADLRRHAAQLNVPVYLRVGSEDAACPPERSREFARLLPDAELDIVEGAGHFIHFEDREGTAGSLVEFFERR